MQYLSENRKFGLNGNVLKIIACVSMLLDHIGFFLFPGARWLRMAGRLAMPIFAFFVAEGCKYTRNKTRHLLTIAALGLIFYVVEVLAANADVQNIFLTFSLSICIIYSLDYLKQLVFSKEKNASAILGAVVIVSLVTFASIMVVYAGHFDYGLIGMLTPVAVSLVDFSMANKDALWVKIVDNIFVRLILLSIMLTVLLFNSGLPMEVQAHSFIALLPLLLYSGKRGRLNLKYYFYAFYPLHVAIIVGISYVI